MIRSLPILMPRRVVASIISLGILAIGAGCPRREDDVDGMLHLRSEYFRFLPVSESGADSICVVHEFDRDIWRTDFLADVVASAKVLDAITNRCQKVSILGATPSAPAERVIETASFGPMDFPCSRAEVAQAHWIIPGNLMDCAVYYFREVPPGRSSVEAIFIVPPSTNRVMVFGIRSSG